MTEYKTGNILNENAEAIINTVNCVGIMGRGIALQFKKHFPENFKAYALACKNGEVLPGNMFVFETKQLTSPRLIINFPTKRHWRGKSRIEDIQSGLVALVETIRKYNIKSIAIPPLGSGLGGLDWLEVKPIINKALDPLTDIKIIIYEPSTMHVTDKIVNNKAVPQMSSGRAALIKLMDSYLRGLLDPMISLLEVHKLMYFLQESGEPLRLQYKPAQYGPYAENLRHVLNAIEVHFISGYGYGGDNPRKQLDLVPGAIEEANDFLKNIPYTSNRIDKVLALVDGFETSFGLELLSTVYWVIKNKTINSVDDVITEVYAWNEHKRQFTPRQIKLSCEILTNQKWITSNLQVIS